MIENLHHYNCELKRIIDGDTVELIIDLGFNIKIETDLRLEGIDTPEVNSSNGLEQEAAYRSEVFLGQLIEKEELIVRTKKNDMYGRYIGTLFIKGQHELVNVNNFMLNHGLGRKYDGGKRKKWTDKELNTIIKK